LSVDIKATMDSEDRDWYQEPPPRSRNGLAGVFALVALLVVLAAVVGIKWMNRPQPTSASAEQQSRPGDLELRVVPGLLSLTIKKGSLYPEHDPWKSYLANEETCPGAERTDLPLNQQADIMVCLVNYARRQRGLPELAIYPLLNDASLAKAGEIVRCNDFAHDPCGEDPAGATRAAGYLGAWGENLYVGEDKLGAPRVALDGWLNSPGHRENLFRLDWRSQGIAVMKVAKLESYSNATIWVNEFAAN
jgi:uncharacterized protein YkwD